MGLCIDLLYADSLKQLNLFVHSLTIMEPLIPQDVCELNMWKSWVAHRELLMFATRPSFDMGDDVVLGMLVGQYLKAFDQARDFA